MKTRTYWPPGVVRYDPQELFDALPEETRERIDLEDFRNVLLMLDAFHANFILDHHLKDSMRYLTQLDEVTREEPT